MYTNCLKVVVGLALLAMAAYSEAPKPEPAAAENASSGPVSGKTAFWQMYKRAYSWAKDVVPLKLESKELPGVKNEGGKAGMWTATFGSSTKHQAVVITYAVAAHSPDIYKGNNVESPIPWGGPTRDVMPFQTSDLVIDSDAAYKTAEADANAWLKKHPNKQVTFLLGNNPTRFSAPVWYILWGDNKSGYASFVNAISGSLMKGRK
jgi:hypothetical protein